MCSLLLITVLTTKYALLISSPIWIRSHKVKYFLAVSQQTNRIINSIDTDVPTDLCS